MHMLFADRGLDSISVSQSLCLFIQKLLPKFDLKFSHIFYSSDIYFLTHSISHQSTFTVMSTAWDSFYSDEHSFERQSDKIIFNVT
jgi:hypothetical protein